MIFEWNTAWDGSTHVIRRDTSEQPDRVIQTTIDIDGATVHKESDQWPEWSSAAPVVATVAGFLRGSLIGGFAMYAATYGLKNYMKTARPITFEYGGHSFRFQGSSLAVDGSVVGQGKTVTMQGSTPAYKVVRDEDLGEHDEIIRTDEFRVDNAKGTALLPVERELSMTVTNQVTLTIPGEFDDQARIPVGVVTAEIAARVTQETGHQFNQNVTVRDKQTFLVEPGTAVTFRIEWKRHVRNGRHIVLVDTREVTIPYEAHYGLTYDIETESVTPA
jgi:hypothetical protein